jgi:ribosomal protein S18 acetylase RimI-like enzyme
MIEFIIREFQFPADYQDVMTFWSSMDEGIHVSASDEFDEIKKKVARDPDLFLVADKDGIIIGTVMGGYDGRRGLVYHLAVSPSHRNCGVATRLMDELEKRLTNKGCIKCYLLVLPDNLNAMRWYEKAGWEKMTVVPYAKNLARPSYNSGC